MRDLGLGRKVGLAVATGAVALGLGMPTLASAQTLYTGTPVPNAGAVDTSAGADGGPVPGLASPEVHTQGSTGLAFTGIDVAELGLVGLAAIATGSVLVRRGRRAD